VRTVMTAEKRIEELIKEVNSGLYKKFKEKLTKIILFGSYARGDFDNESDLDLLVLIEDEEPVRYSDEIVDFEVDLTIKYGILPSIILRNTGYFNDNKGIIPFFRNVEKEGVEIYAA
jgi:predicted nucleotidyltransferase